MRARLLHAAKSAQAMGQIAMPAGQAPTLLEAWELYRKDWLEAKGKRFAYDQSLINGHLAPIRQKPLNLITPHDLDLIMADMRQKGCASQTIRLAVGLVSRIMRRMTAWRLYAGPMPFDGITLPKLNNQRARFLTPHEARTLLAEIKKRSHKTWLMSMISLHCGLRFSEIARLCWSDVDFSDMSLHIREAKSGYGRHAVLTEDIAAALRSLPGGLPSELLFPSKNGGVLSAVPDTFSRVVDYLGLNAGITDRRQRIVFHSLRHTYASWLAKSGQGQLVIADRLGHRSIQMTMRYTHLMDETRKASADAISQIFHDDLPESR